MVEIGPDSGITAALAGYKGRQNERPAARSAEPVERTAGASISAPTAAEIYPRYAHACRSLWAIFSRAVIRNTLRLSDTSEVETTGRFCLPHDVSWTRYPVTIPAME
jgi:hypothetical protein